MEQLDLNQIRNFVRVVQAGSFTKAAANLHQPKSRVSRRLAALEKSLGVQLIYRTTRQFQLTENGKKYFERCREIIDELENIASAVKENTSQVTGLIRITASDDMGVTLLAPLLDEFTRLNPNVKFDIVLTQSYLDLVKESIDVAVRIGSLKDSNLKVRRVHSLRSVLVATPSFLERYRVQDDIQQLSQAPYIGLGSGKNLHLIKSSDGRKIKIKVEPQFNCNNPSMMLALTLRGRGFALIPEFLCVEHIRSGRLIHFQKHFQSDEVGVHLVTPDQKETPLKIKKFMDFIIKKLRESLSTSI